MIVAALALALYGLRGSISSTMNALLGIGAPVVGGFFIALTLLLLIADLKRPDRALYLILKSNPTSWLVWGAYIFGIFGLIEALWFIAALFATPDLIRWLLIPAALFGAAGAGYTAFLFGQAEGRDFWQSPLLLPVLLVQALIGGAAALGLLSWALGGDSRLGQLCAIVLLSTIVLHVLLVMVEVFGSHANKHVTLAARYMSKGGLKEVFWLPYFLREGRGKVAAYFTHVYNPVWTNPDGTGWIEALTNEQQIELHAALTPVWSVTAWYADYVLPMGVGSERHDLMSQETHAGRWIGFRQPVLRIYKEHHGKPVAFTYQANPGEVWEEDEFWIELSWRIDPDGSLGIRKYFESPYRPGQKLAIEEYYRWMFENSVPGLPEAAAKENLTSLAYMRKYGAFEIPQEKAPVYTLNERELKLAELEDTQVDETTGKITRNGTAVGVMIDGKAYEGFPTLSRKLEFYSATLKDWGWPEYAIPGYTSSHVHRAAIDHERG